MFVKWKKNIVLKTAAFALAVVCLTLACSMLINSFIEYQVDIFSVFEANFENSQMLQEKFDEAAWPILRLCYYRSEEYIKSGALVTDAMIESETQRLFEDFRSRFYYDDERELYYSEYSGTEEPTNPSWDEEQLYKLFTQQWSQRIAALRDALIEEQLLDFRYQLERFQQANYLTYYYKLGDYVKASDASLSRADFLKMPAYKLYANASYTNSLSSGLHSDYIGYEIQNQIDRSRELAGLSVTDDAVLYLGMDEASYSAMQSSYNQSRAYYLGILRDVGLLALTALVAVVFLCSAAGYTTRQEGVRLLLCDRLFLEVHAIIVGLVITGDAYLITLLYYRAINQSLFTVLIAMSIVIILNFVLAIAKNVKNHSFIQHTLILLIPYKLWQAIRGAVRTAAMSGPVVVRIFVVVFGLELLLFLTMAALFTNSGFLVLVGLLILAGANIVVLRLLVKNCREYSAIREGVSRVKGGELNYKINLPGDGELATLARNIDTISEGLQNAVEGEVKSERMKAELVTNVSHDIKTPLTSIINYIDLLKTEGPGGEHFEEYVNILEQKAARLKNLTEDLFEATKASSGNIPFTLDQVDAVALITQSLGELDDKIEASGLTFRTAFTEDRIMVLADGKLLWRVLENLFSNVFKYAAPQSRVYVTVATSGGNAVIVVKNVSAYELNLPEEELMERFKRGDEARASEGSGLGLSIARSLTELMGGSFKIEIDGDLFKATVTIPLVS